VPIGTVMSRLSRARRTIGDRFRNPEGQPRRIDTTPGAREEDA